ncbi:hypothetical protein AVEN_143354-1 [Araneus ventricosus]|uniref:Uncharacterized protein n=1 Tax=Araneus ventricosus TaxID=182803 RepID=A0A4Y2AEL0_ARAVE|nr:hypothetical protein AVEN_143354-1 [Araneus ventricosus]
MLFTLIGRCSFMLCLKLDIHHKVALRHLDQKTVCFPRIQAPKTKTPKRTNGCFDSPTPPTGYFRFLKGAPFPLRPDFSSMTPTHIPPPQPSSHTWLIYRPPRKIIFHFYGRTG